MFDGEMARTLTEAGADYLVRAEAILSALEEADHMARGTGELRGVLRVAMSSSLAVRTVLPRLTRFTDPHPSLRVEFTLADERQDLISEAIDVAVRVGSLADSTGAVARKIGVMQRVLVASPSYLAKCGTPRKPVDLASHPIIMGRQRAGRRPGHSTRARSKTPSVCRVASSSTAMRALRLPPSQAWALHRPAIWDLPMN